MIDLKKQGLQPLKGLEGLSSPEKRAWLDKQVKAGVLPKNYTYSQAAQLYRNGQYIDKYTLDDFRANPDPNLREEKFKSDIVSEVVDSTYANDPNYESIKSFSLDDQISLIEQGYLGKDARILNNQQRTKDALEAAKAGGIYSNSYLESARDAEEKRDADIFSKLSAKEDRERATAALSYANDISQRVSAALVNDEISEDEITESFDDLFSGGTRQFETPGGTLSVDMPGSDYWKIFKDRRELKDLGISDKVKLMAIYDHISSAPNGGQDKAMSAVNTLLQDYINENQTFGDWLGDTGKGIITKAAASTMQGVSAFSMMGKLDNPDELIAFMKGQDLEGNELPNWQNLTYWNDVYQYNAFDKTKLQNIKNANGISPYKYITEAGREFSTGAAVVSEAIQQGGNDLATYLPLLVTGGAASALSTVGKVGMYLGKAINVASAFGTALPESTMEAKIVFDGILNDTKENYNIKTRKEAEEFAEREVASGKYQKEIDTYVDKMLKEQEKRNATQERPISLSKEYFQQQATETMKAFLADKAFNDAPKLDIQQAERQALGGAGIAFGTFILRNAAENFAFKDYLFNRAFREGNFINKVSRSLTRGPEGYKQINKGLNKILAVATPIVGGAVSEYNDSLTEGFAEGFSLNKFNDITNHQYSGEDYLEGANLLSTFGANLYAGMLKVQDAATSKDALYEAAIGAIGPIVNITFAQPGEIKTEGAGTLEKLNRYIKNPLFSYYFDEKYRQESLDRELSIINPIIANHKDDIAKFGNILSSIQLRNAATTKADSQDQKERQAFDLLSILIDLETSQVAGHIQESQDVLSLLQTIKKGDTKDQVFQKAIKDFLIDNNLTEDNIGEAITTLKDNASYLLDMYDNYIKVAERIKNDDTFSDSKNETKKQAIFGLVMDKVWRDRLQTIEEKLGTTTKYIGTPTIIKYPSLETLNHEVASTERDIKSIEESINKIESSIQKLKEKVAEKGDKNSNIEAEILLNQSKLKKQRNTLNILKQKQKDLQKEREDFINNSVTTLSANEILNLNPEERDYIIKNKDLYTKEQIEQIDILESRLSERDPQYKNSLGEASSIYKRIKDNESANRAIKEAPKAFDFYVDLVKRSRAAHINKLMERRAFRLFEKNAELLEDEELVDYAVNNGVSEYILSDYLEAHPEKENILSPIIKVRRFQSDIFNTIDNSTTLSKELKGLWIKAVRSAILNSKSVEEAMDSLEDLIDVQNNDLAKNALNSILEESKSLGYMRNATKVRNRELEKQRKLEEQERKKKEEFYKDGKNFGWEGYRVGDIVYNKQSGNPAIVEGFVTTDSGDKKMLLFIRANDGSTLHIYYDSVTGKDKITKNKPAVVKEKPNIEETPIGDNTPTQESFTGEAEEVNLIDSDGRLDSPAAEQQASEIGVNAVPVTEDSTDQGNVIPEDTPGVLLGNKFVEYSINSLVNNNAVELETPVNENSIFAEFREWLNNTKTKLQEIIDEEFLPLYVENPNIPIHFMMFKDEEGSPIKELLVNVIEYTPEVKKVHNEERGGVIFANGKYWLVVGTTGFTSKNETQRQEYITMRGPISKRRYSYFKNNPKEMYYVDTVAETRVFETTSGRIINKKLGEKEARLRRVSELLEESNMSLKQAKFGVQTNRAGVESFAPTEREKTVYPPKNKAGNLGRVFILLDTPNGKKIPGMIEPAMYSSLKEDSPLKKIIQQELANLTSTDYGTRKVAITKLVQLLVLNEDQNILIGTEKINVLTLKRKGLPDITYRLGKDFDLSKFLSDIEDTNFRVNVTLQTLNDPDFLKIYDDSDALMTSVASMHTVGASYTIYATDEDGQIIERASARNNQPGTGKTEIKTYRSVRVNNITYELRNGRFINRDTQKEVDMSSLIGISCLYNDDIQVNNRQMFSSSKNLEYYLYIDNSGKQFIVSRDRKGNINILNEEESAKIISPIQNEVSAKTKLKAVEDVALGDTTPPSREVKPQEELPMEQVKKQLLGDFTSPSVSTDNPPQDIIPEPSKPKEIISSVGTKSLESLQNSENLPKFEALMSSRSERTRFFEIVSKKDWGITKKTSFSDIEKILEHHGVSTLNIPKDASEWLDMIEKCKV